MNELVNLLLACFVGLLVGAIFFGGLWWTVRRNLASQRPALWFFGSLLLRMAIALAGFYVVSGGDLGRLLACLVGFTLARPLVTWLTRSPGALPTRSSREAGHGP
jgi:F1F0 ATPase subunit 2